MTPLNVLFVPELPVQQAEIISSVVLASEALVLQSPLLSQLPALGSDLHLHQRCPLLGFTLSPLSLSSLSPHSPLLSC